jgi:hypothetical protein
MSNKLIALNDIKYDLLKIIEPWDGVLSEKQYYPVLNLFKSYFDDLKKSESIRDYSISYTTKDNTISYDVSVKISNERSPKKLKIHVGTFKYPWITSKKSVNKPRNKTVVQ